MMDKSKEIIEKENPKGLGGCLILVGTDVVFLYNLEVLNGC